MGLVGESGKILGRPQPPVPSYRPSGGPQLPATKYRSEAEQKAAEAYEREKAAYDALMKTIAPYKKDDNTYDVLAALQGGVNRDTLVQAFGEEAVNQAQEYNSARLKLEPYVTEYGYSGDERGYDVYTAIEKGLTDELKLVAGFTDSHITEFTGRIPHVRYKEELFDKLKSSKYDAGDGNFYLTQAYLDNFITASDILAITGSATTTNEILDGAKEVQNWQETMELLGEPEGPGDTYTADQINKAIGEGASVEVVKQMFEITGDDLYKMSFPVAEKVVKPAAVSQIQMPQVSEAGEPPKTEAAKGIWSQIWQGMTPWDESKGETVSTGKNVIWGGGKTRGGAAGTAASVATMFLEIVVPGVYASRYWDEMSTVEKGTVVALDVVSMIPILGGVARGARLLTSVSRVSAKQARAAVQAAKAVSKTQKALRQATTVLKRTKLESPKYFKVASDAQYAIQAAKVADDKFLTALSNVSKVSPGQLANMEKLTGFKGLAKAIKNLGAKQTALKKAWRNLELKTATTRKLGKSELQIMSKKSYMKKLTDVQAARESLQTALDKANDVLKPLYQTRKKLIAGRKYRMPTASERRLIAERVRQVFKGTYGQKGSIQTMKPASLEVRSQRVQTLVMDIEKKAKLRQLENMYMQTAMKELWERTALRQAVTPTESVARVISKPITIARNSLFTKTFAKTLTKMVTGSLAAHGVILTATQAAQLTEAATKLANSTATATQTTGQTSVAIITSPYTSTVTQIVNKTNLAPAQKLELVTKLESLTREAVGTPIRLSLRPSLRTTWRATPKDIKKYPPIVMIRSEGKIIKITRKDLEGANAFKQGFMYWLILKDGRTIATRKPVPGVPLVEGEGSPQKSAITLGKGIDATRKIKMGKSTAILYDPPGKGRPKISYKKAQSLSRMK